MGEESLAFGQVEDELGPPAPEDLDWLVLLSVQAEALFPSFKLRIVFKLSKLSGHLAYPG